MLEQLFGSNTRVRLLRLFMNNFQQAYFVRELTRRIGAQINSVRNELENLLDLGLVVEVREKGGAPAGDARAPQKKFYKINADSLMFPELRALFLKARIMVEKDFVQKVGLSGNISYLALTGFFTGAEGAPTDLFIVGRINRNRLTSLIRGFEREAGREINYTVMTPQEYKYRRDVTDRFLYSILESPKIVVIDAVLEKAGAAV